MNINEIKPNPNNPRTIKDENFKKLVQSIKDFPEMLDARPLILNKDNIILGGNMRYKAAKEAGLKDLPVKIVDWSEDKQKEFIIKDNVSGGDWDWDLLANEWSAGELDSWGLELPDSWQEEPEVVEDEAPEVSSEPPISKLGEIYQLGRHRVMCGSATVDDDVTKLMNGNLADLVVTDPPYNTGMTGKGNTFDYDWKKKKKDEKAWLSHMFNDSYTPEEWQQFLRDTFTSYVINTKGDCAFYIFIDWRRVGDIRTEVEKHMDVKNVIVWDKKVHGLGSDYKSTYELVIVGKKGKPEINNRFGLDYQDIWRLQREMGRNKDHATAKPIELCVKPIKHASKADDIVLDLFLGSGSTLIACGQTDRTCYGMELDPKYVDVIRKRYAKFTAPDNQLPENWAELTPVVQ